jgi:hypothetical protein
MSNKKNQLEPIFISYLVLIGAILLEKILYTAEHILNNFHWMAFHQNCLSEEHIGKINSCHYGRYENV